MKVRDNQPAPHAKYIVLRNGSLFTATPCYGMHAPWWVVLTMGPNLEEAPPVPMEPEDEWWSKAEHRVLAAEMEKLRERVAELEAEKAGGKHEVTG